MNKLIMVGLLEGKAKECCRRVYDEDGIAPTLNTCGGGQREPKVLVKPKIIKIPLQVNNDFINQK